MQETIIGLEITTSYCQRADFLAAVGHRDDPQCQMNTAAASFNGKDERSHSFLKEYRHLPVCRNIRMKELPHLL